MDLPKDDDGLDEPSDGSPRHLTHRPKRDQDKHIFRLAVDRETMAKHRDLAYHQDISISASIRRSMLLALFMVERYELNQRFFVGEDEDSLSEIVFLYE